MKGKFIKIKAQILSRGLGQWAVETAWCGGIGTPVKALGSRVLPKAQISTNNARMGLNFSCPVSDHRPLPLWPLHSSEDRLVHPCLLIPTPQHCVLKFTLGLLPITNHGLVTSERGGTGASETAEARVVHKQP